jgi:predicted aspartyl protease
MWRFLSLSGRYASGQRSLELAHKLAPGDSDIRQAWEVSHATPPSRDVQIALLKARLDPKATPALSDENREGIEAAIKGLESGETGTCEQVGSMTEAKVPLHAIDNGIDHGPMDAQAIGLDVELNGKFNRLEVDTGATGLVLSRSAAKAAGLVSETRIKVGGIGDEGLAGAFVTHVDDIKVGKMEFRNCMVTVIERSRLNDIDGLIGSDVFRDYVVTLDIPSRELRLGPLPLRPGEVAKPAMLHASEDEQSQLSIADRATDRYVAPEMKDWSRVFRAGHFLIFPTTIGNAPLKLFLMDTGAEMGMITPAAAREVTHISGDSEMIMKGLNGEVRNLMATDKVSITFAHVQQTTIGMRSFDSGALSHVAGVELSGLIGFPTLRELIISIDYRDNLVQVVYDPKKGGFVNLIWPLLMV